MEQLKFTREQAAKFAAGRMLAVQRAPYLSDAVLALQPRLVPNGTISEKGTFGCDEFGNLYVEVGAIDRYDARDVETGLLHEAFHCYVYEHAARCRAHGLDPADYNLAGDAEINDDLRALGCQMLPTDILPASFGARDGLTAEEYYAIIRQQREQGKTVPKKSCACGSCSGNPGLAEPKLPPEADQGGRTPVAVVRAQVAKAVREAAAAGAGNVPAGLRTWAQEQVEAKSIPWDVRLGRLVRVGVGARAGAVDYHYGRASRRQAGLGHGAGAPRLPGLMAPTPRVTVIFDTSGSMLGQSMAEGISQVEKIVRAVGASITLINVDVQVNAAERVQDKRSLLMTLGKGGGGTELQPGFDKAAKAAADVIVCVTDGQLFTEPKKPRTPVIWLLTGDYPGMPAPWGDKIYMSEAAERRMRGNARAAR